jgi:two-component system, LytTR family, sensor kinase
VRSPAKSFKSKQGMYSAVNEAENGIVPGEPRSKQFAVAQAPWKRAPGLLFVWTFIGAVGYARNQLQQGGARPETDFWLGLFDWLPCYWAWIPFTPLVFHLERRFLPARASWHKYIPILAVASVLLSYASYLTVTPIALLIHALEGRLLTKPQINWSMSLGEFCIEQFMFWSIAAAAFVIRRLDKLRLQEREAARFALERADLEATLRKAELEMLRMRLNPHFLFNSLQNISVLAQQDPRLASRMLTRLGDLLRAAFKNDFQSEVTLEAEIGLTVSYLEIEKMRLGERLHVVLDIAPDTRALLVPSLLLQPLAENAIVHGLAGANNGRISIRSKIEDNRLILSIADNGTGLNARDWQKFNKGVGLASVYDRLTRMYPGEHKIFVERALDGGTVVCIVLPVSRRSEMCAVTNEQARFEKSHSSG